MSTEPTEIKAIIFDADGVVIDKPYVFSQYLEATYGLTPQDTAPFFVGVFLDCLTGKADLKVEIAHYLPAWHWQKSTEEFLQLWFDVENAPDQQLLAVITKLRQQGIACHLGTNQEHYRVDYMKSTMRFAEQFDSVFSSASVGAMKPAPAFYQRVTEQLHLEPRHILFFDDALKNVEAARACGWHAEHYTGRISFDAALAAYGLKL